MNSLLKRQIRKYLNEHNKNSADIKDLLDAVNRSYLNYEDQLQMLQRAMSISSQELYDANTKLREEALQQRKVIASLTDATKILKTITFKKEVKESGETQELDGIELAATIEKQAIQISKIEQQREQILKDLEKSNKELTNYAQVVSHDLKSPLRNINALINWIKEDSDQLDGTTQSHLALIDKNIEKMDNLISGILEYSVIDKKEEVVQVVNMNRIVSETINLLHAPDHVQFEIANPLPQVKGDPYRLRQLFQNLISNAIASIDKPKGEISIGSELKNKAIEFYVKDNGKGIDQKYHQKIFQIFESVETNKESTGIGLSIVKKIVDYYEGEIRLASVPGKGSTFYFTLSRAQYE